ncbi:TonB-dependent receptor [Belliella sp. DSM 111904]|uniref:TonB-dependent receptor n=1 Tax=Belliella filtrata TaxID=2923435 RepID=A0ABS9V2K1_9BACT|nr:TonB-dependent receptor [Belliella filtrata]MCH7410439.1 TonB-dependent receptor [Belliella filtrata]
MKKKILTNLFMKITMHTIIVSTLFYLGSGVVWAFNTEDQELKNTKLVFREQSINLKSLIGKIERESDFRFVYEESIDLSKQLEMPKAHINLEQTLEIVSGQLNLKFKQINHTISVHNNFKDSDAKQAALELITGKVMDTSGEPIPGATIIVEGSSLGTVTDSEGNFSLEVPPGGSLVVSFIGYKSIRVEVGNRTNIQVTMSDDETSLEEFVVVGYGSVERRELTGSISSISRKDIIAEPIYSFEGILQGKAAGVDVVADSYRPGAGATVRIRGSRSLVAGNDPLIVMDGVPIDGNLMDINPSDIESIEVLKDASATAIYGSRGSNGVILVTTRRGYSGGTQIEYSAFYGVQNMSNRVDLMSADQYIEMNREAARHQGTYTTDETLFLDWELEAIQRGVDTDWQKEAFQTGFQQNHQLSVRGGTEDTRYAISGTYLDHKAIVSNNDFSRFVGRVNLDQDVSKSVRAGVSAQVTRSVEHRGGDFRELVLRSPLDWPARAEGALGSEFAVGENFPTLALDRNLFIDRRDRTRVVSNLFGEIDVVDGLSYRFNFAPDLTFYDRGTHTWQTSTASVSNSKSNNILFENIVNFDKSFGENHKIKATGLYSVQSYTETGASISVRGLPFEQQRYHNIGTAEETTARSSFLNEWQLESYMLRLNYSLMNKYLFTLTGRVDGSSRLAEGNKYGLFPSAAFAWLIDQEDFFKSQSKIDELKLRMSYGEVGNTGINPYQTQGRVQRVGYAFGDQSVFGFQSAELANSALRWERTRQVDLGIDFGLFSGRIAGTIGVYQQNTLDLLMNRQLPPTSGFVSVLENVGATRNRGFEFNLSVVNFESNRPGGFRWSTDIIFHTNKNQITELYGGKEDDPGNRWFIGQPINVYFDWEFEGIWQESERSLAAEFGHEPGDIKLRDINNDGRIDAADRVILGSDVPSWTGSINNRMYYKNFDLAFFVYTTQGITIFSEAGGTSLGGMINLRRGYNLNSRNISYWTPENPSNEFPRPRVRGHDYSTPMGYFDASFVRVRNITLGYSLPAEKAERIKISRARVYGGVQNPFTFTQFPGLDPEGARNHDMPNYRTFLVGIELGF